MSSLADSAAAVKPSPALARWRVANEAAMAHLRRSLDCDCGMSLCPEGQRLWDDANEAEAALPWWRY